MTESDNYLANLVGTLGLAIADRQRAACEAVLNLGPAAPAALVAIAQYSGETVGFFEPILGLTSSGTVRLFDRLVGAGLITRRPGEDRRTVSVALTAQGRRRAVAINDARLATVNEILDSLTAAQRRELIPLVKAPLASLTDSRSTARRMCRLCDHARCDDMDRCPVDHAATAQGDPRYRDLS